MITALSAGEGWPGDKSVSDTDFCQGGRGRHGRTADGSVRERRRSRRSSSSRSPRLVGHVAVPGDKSISHRAVLIGAICDGETRISGFGRSADTEATIAAVRALGVEVYEHGAETLRVFGKGLRGLRAPGRADRLRQRRHARSADRRHPRRPGGRGVRADGRRVALAAADGADRGAARGAWGPAWRRPTGTCRCGSRGGSCAAIDYVLPVASAQVKSAILLAGLFADGRDDGRRARADPRPHRAHARRGGRERAPSVRRASTVEPRRAARRSARSRCRATSRPPRRSSSRRRSSRAPSSTSTGSTSTRAGPGCSTILERMGARITSLQPARRSAASRPATSRCTPRALVGDDGRRRRRCRSRSTSCRSFALAAACARGESVLRGAAELRAKETDRIEATVDALRALGVRARGPRRRLRDHRRPGAAARRTDREPGRPSPGDARRGRGPVVPRGRADRRRGRGRGELPRLLRDARRASPRVGGRGRPPITSAR